MCLIKQVYAYFSLEPGFPPSHTIIIKRLILHTERESLVPGYAYFLNVDVIEQR